MAASPQPRLVPSQLRQTAARGTLKVAVVVGSIVLITVLPLPTLSVIVVTLIALRLLLLPV